MKNMECSKVYDMLSDYLDGELPGDICQHIDGHIQLCPSCADFVARLRLGRDLCHQLQMKEMPAPMRAEAKADLLAAYQRMLASRR